MSAPVSNSTKQSNTALQLVPAQTTSADVTITQEELVKKVSLASEALGLPSVTSLPPIDNEAALAEALSNHFNPPSKKKEFAEKEIQAVKQAGLIIPLLKWPQAYQQLTVKRAIQLHLLKFWKSFEATGKIEHADKGFMITLIHSLQGRPFHDFNKKTFEQFKSKVSPLLRKEFKDYHALLFLTSSPHFTDKTIQALTPQPLTAAAVVPSIANHRAELLHLTTACLPVFTKGVISLLNDTLFLLQQEDFTKNILIIKNLTFKQQDLEAFTRDLKRFCTICAARRNDVEEKMHLLMLQLQSGGSQDHIRYYLQDIFSKIALFRSQAEKLRSSLKAVYPHLDCLFPSLEVNAIYKEEFCYSFDDSSAQEDMLELTRTMAASQFGFASLKSQMDDSNKKVNEITDLVKATESNKHDDEADKSESMALMQSVADKTNELSTIMTKMSESHFKLFDQFGSSMQALNNLAKSKNILRETVEKKFKKLVKQKKITQDKLNDKLAVAKVLFRQMCRHEAQLDVFTTGLDALKHFLEEFQTIWLDTPKAEMPDLDVLWPEFHDRIPHELETLKFSPTKSSDLEKENDSKAEAAEVSVTATAAASAAAAKASDPQSQSTFTQNVMVLSKLTRANFSPHDPLVSKFSLSDAALHIGILASTASLLRHFNSNKSIAGYIPHMSKRIVRNSSVATELIYSARLFAQNAPYETISHSQLDMELIAKIANSVSHMPSKKRIDKFLQDIDYGSVSSRYPGVTVGLCAHKKLAVPKTLQWGTQEKPILLKEVQELASDTFLFIEHAIGQKTHAISEMIQKELSLSSPAMTSMGKNTHSTLLNPIFNDLSIVMNKVQAKVKRYEDAVDPLMIQSKTIWKDALSQLQNLNDALNLWILFPQAEFFASHVDAILTATQLQDELVEEALHIAINSKVLHSHKLFLYRELRACQLEPQEHAAIYDFDIGSGAQYVSQHQYFLKHRKENPIAPKQQPKALSWRQDALEVSMNSEAYDSGMTPAGRKIDYPELQKQIIQKVAMMLNITKKTLTNKL